MNTNQSVSYRKSFQQRPGWRRFGWGTIKTILAIALAMTLVPAASGAAAFGTLLFAPLPGDIPDEENEEFRTQYLPSYAYDQDGRQIAEYRQFDLTVETTPDDIPDVVKNAVVAAEDRRFWEHNGVDITGMARALVANYRAGDVVQGGSTITQQYVKNRFLTRDKEVERKIREAVLATELEREMEKEDILFDYLQTTYWGEGAYGIGAAAETYFRMSVADLGPSEAAVLAGLIPSPSTRNPRQNAEASEFHRVRVLDAMLEEGYLTKDEHRVESARQLWYAGFGPAPGPATVIFPPELDTDRIYPYFQDWVHDYVLNTYGEDMLYRGGLRIETTLDREIQQLAIDSVATQLDRIGEDAPLEMAMATVHPSTGHIKALVGGRDWSRSQVNLATGGSTGFQPGSSFKPIVLANAYANGIGPETIYPSPAVFKVPGCGGGAGCTVNNYGGGGGGSKTLEQATHSSTNTVYAALITDVGIQSTAKLANAMGVSAIRPDEETYGLSLSLGAYEVSPLDMAAAYSTLAAHGVAKEPTAILRILDHEGNVLEDNTFREGVRVLPASVADTVTQTLTGVVSGGTGKNAQIGRDAAGKTGTAQEYSAAWFVGYTPQLATSVWVGYSDGWRSLPGRMTGGSHPAQAWGRFMRAAHEDLPKLDFPEPDPLPEKVAAGFEPGTANTPIAEVPPSIDSGRQRQPALTPTDCAGGCVQRVDVAVEADNQDSSEDSSEDSQDGEGSTNSRRQTAGEQE